MTPEHIEKKFGEFGKPTIKHQLIITPKTRAVILGSKPPIIFYPDTPNFSSKTTNSYKAPICSFRAFPIAGHIYSLDVLREKLVDRLIGKKLEAAETKNRGQALELIVARFLGYKPDKNELLMGGFPDIRNQILEVKVQDSPTVDLGMFNPQFSSGPVPWTLNSTMSDVRYLIALTHPRTGLVEGLILCPGSKLGDHFSYVSDTSYKCQRSIPMKFFDQFDGQSVFNPQSSKIGSTPNTFPASISSSFSSFSRL